MVDSVFPQLVRNRKRFDEIVRTLAKYGLADWVREWNPEFVKGQFRTPDGQKIAEMPPGVRLRLAFSELGTTFIKIGQLLSTRSDLLGPEIAAELAQLQSNTPADPAETVAALIEAELGQPPEQLFAEFERDAMASASIGQVHAARLVDGQTVVVKVQHQGIEDTVLKDLEILDAFSAIAERHGRELRKYRPRATVAEFRKRLLYELDFQHELRNLERFAHNFRDNPTVHFPRAHRHLSTRRVLTMERLDGFSVADRERLESEGVDTKEVSRRGVDMALEMIFRDGFYHADLHPGNILILSGGVVGVLDCGMAGRIDEKTREDFENLILAASERDSDQITDTVLRIGSTPPDLDRDALRVEIDDFAADFVGQSLTDFDLSATLQRGLEIVRRFGIALKPSIASLFRALVMLEGTSRTLDRDFSLAETIQPYYLKIVQRRLAPARLWRRVQRSYRDWERLLDMLPRVASDILSRLRQGTFDVHLEHRRLEVTTNRLIYGIVTASLFLGSALLWSRDAPPVVGGMSIVGVAGVILSAVLGFRLLRSIARSGGIQPKA